MKKTLIIICMLPLIMGLRSIEFKGYKDPDFLDYKIGSAILCFGSTTMVLEDSFIKSFSKQKSTKNLNWKTCDDVYPPTREWDPDSRNALALKNGFTSMIGVGIDFAVTNDSTGTYYNDGIAISSPLSSQSEYEIIIYDFESQRKVWVAKVGVVNRGTFFAGNAKGEAKALAKRLAKELQKASLL